MAMDTFADGINLLDCIRIKMAYLFAEPQMQQKDTEIRQQYQKIGELQTDLEAAQQRILQLTAQLEELSSAGAKQSD